MWLKRDFATKAKIKFFIKLLFCKFQKVTAKATKWSMNDKAKRHRSLQRLKTYGRTESQHLHIFKAVNFSSYPLNENSCQSFGYYFPSTKYPMYLFTAELTGLSAVPGKTESFGHGQGLNLGPHDYQSSLSIIWPLCPPSWTILLTINEKLYEIKAI